MDCFVTSLDSENKRLDIQSGGGLQSYDTFINTQGLFPMSMPQLIASGIGTGNYKNQCPLQKACMDVMHLFKDSKEACLDIKGFLKGDAAFSFNTDDIITFATEDLPGIEYRRVDFIQSREKFFGIRTRHDYGQDYDTLDQKNVIWLCGPDNNDLAHAFGESAYLERREIFGHLYGLAQNRQMANPIMPGKMNY